MYKHVLEVLTDKHRISLTGLSTTSAKAFWVNTFLDSYERGALWLSEDPEVTQKAYNDFQIWSDKPAALLADPDHQGEVLSILSGNSNGVIFGTIEDYKSAKLPSKDIYTNSIVTLTSGTRMSHLELFEHLNGIGYQSDETKLSRKGFYHRRGGIVDIYLTHSPYPVRVEFFEDQIDSIFSYDIITGKKIEDLAEVALYPVDVTGVKVGIESYMDDSLIFFDEVDEQVRLKCKHSIIFTPFVHQEYDTISVPFPSILRYSTPLEFLSDLKEKLSQNWDIYIFAQDREHIWNFLTSKEFTSQELEHVSILGNGQYETWMTDQQRYKTERRDLEMPETFLSEDEKVLCITQKEIFGSSSGSVATEEHVGNAFLDSLHQGDFVIHIDHGIGIFNGVSRNTFSGIEREYLTVEYAKADKLYIPVDKAEKINKFLGVDIPKLTSLGSSEWDTVTRKLKEDSDRIARELLDIYAQRQMAKGYAFDIDNDKQSAFEAGFEHNLTPGQAKAMNEIKRDMESSQPMDRLLCGDVGFGKTEIAMRAAFKAVQSGKQVAFLAPITILVDQQFKAFSSRMSEFGVRVEQLSRFRTPKEQANIIGKLHAGEIDIVVGTHKLLQPDMQFKDLGLVIIDEEQRFGVKQKETLKEMRSNVDFLTLTATPIPRTLNMGLSGLRDISTITTPPPGRLPVHTEIRRFTYPLIRDAILKEIERGGQTYFLHNRVATIESVAEKLRSLLPDVRILVTHGQLTPAELEKRIMAFKNHEYDVLVSSTIIENGIDLSNANTLIVDRAEAFGLAQAYQLRGRVGRSKRQAYAYFLYQAQQLQPDAKKRLKAIMEASDLGSGFQIAMKDLDIRGAGELLGAKQHGALSTVGVAHFSRMIHNAVDKLKANDAQKAFTEEHHEINVDVAVSTLIPDTYIPDVSEKLKWYQRISSAQSLEVLHLLKDEIISLYGLLPEQADNLFKLISLKIIARMSLVGSIEQFKVEGREVVDVILSKQIKPQNILKLLDYSKYWVITGSKLRIEIIDLRTSAQKHSLSWFDELIECVRLLQD